MSGLKKPISLTLDLERALAELPVDLRVKLEKARGLIRALPPAEETTLTRWSVHGLGELGDDDGDATAGIAESLAAVRDAFSVGFCGNGAGQADYTIGTSGADSGQAVRMLRSAFAIAKIREKNEKKYRYQRWAVCERVFMNDDLLKMDGGSKIRADWVNALARAAVDIDCDVQLSFMPLDSAWIKEAIRQTVESLDDLTKYQETSMQVGSNEGSSENISGHIGTRVKEAVVATNKQNNNDSTSNSMNFKQEHWAVSTVCEELKFRIRELEQLRRDGGWCVSALVKTQRESELKLIQAIMGGMLVQLGYRCVWKNMLRTPAAILPAGHLRRLFGYPSDSFPGFEIEHKYSFAANLPETDEPCLEIGNLVWNDTEMDVPLRIPLRDLNSHMFFCGKPGFGKTNSVCSILLALKGIPFMVIEPVKGEYRSLKSVLPDLKVFNLEISGKNQLHMNPFWFPKGGKLNYHIDSLKSIISASFELTAAMPDILAQCLVSAYIKKGWNISTNQNIFAGKLPEEMLYPTFSTLCSEVEQYLEEAAFAPELKSNYKGALLSRLQSFTTGTKGLLLNCPCRPAFDEWIRDGISCVIELDELADDSDKAIIMGTLLSQYFQCIKYGSTHIKPELRHVIVLEEAHHLFRDASQMTAGGSNSRQHLVEMLSNLLAEIRAYGEGVFIVDQSPTNISAQAIKITAVKMVHYTDYADDLKLLQGSLLLDANDGNAPASLKRGYALVRYSSMERPVLVHMPRCDAKEEAGISRERHASADDAQNILDMIRMNRLVREKLLDKCSLFVNHVLFDGPAGKIGALLLLWNEFREEIVKLGFDRETLETLSVDGEAYILRSVIGDSMARKYPNQYLLCGRMQMMIDRFIELYLLQKDGITARQLQLLDGYLRNEVLPALSYYYQNSTDSRIRDLARRFGKEPALSAEAEVLNAMYRSYNLLLEKDKADGSGSNEEKLKTASARKAVWALTMDEVFMKELADDVSSHLWSVFKIYREGLQISLRRKEALTAPVARTDG